MPLSTILVVSQHPARCDLLVKLLRNRDATTVVTDDVGQALETTAREKSLDLVILNGSREYCSPLLEFFTQSRSRLALPSFLVVAAESSEGFAVASLRAGAADYLLEPLDIAAFAQTISRWVPPRQIPRHESNLKGGDILVGNSPAMQALRTHIRRVANTDCNVLITGETGTGKELVAQLVHQNSSRYSHPLICINCAAIPDSLLESELFGYERGAFTGASVSCPGKLMTADKGTVFFDEIGDMSPLAQAKILRAIEAKEVQRLGATRRYETDIRILAATHHDLDDLNSAEHFRRDLYFRLNVGRIHLQPLRERKEDILTITEHIILDLNRKFCRHLESPEPSALDALMQYSWPGNVRELKNVIERVFIQRDYGKIALDDLPAFFRQCSTEKTSSTDYELESLRAALVTCGGNKSKAAEKLNWSRMTLYRKLAKYKLFEESRLRSSGSGGPEIDTDVSRKLA